MARPLTRRMLRWILVTAVALRRCFRVVAAIALLAVSTIAATAHGAESPAPAAACLTLDECLRLAGTSVDCGDHCGVSPADEALAQTIREIGPRAVTGLIALLDASSEQVRDRAGYILASLPALDTTYLTALMHAQQQGTQWMSRAIAHVGTPEAMRFLVADLQRHPEIHGQTAEALISRSSEAVPFLVEGFACADGCDSRFFHTVGQILHDIDKPSSAAVTSLSAIAADEGRPLPLRLRAVYVLGQIDGPAAGLSLDLLGSPAGLMLGSRASSSKPDDAAALDVAISAASHRSGGAAAVPVLVERARAASGSDRALAVSRIGFLGAEGITAGPFVRERLTDVDWDVRVEAAEALGRIGDREAIPDLIEATKSADWRLVYQAAWALGAIGAREAIPQLTHVRQTHWYPPVRALASAALAAMQTGHAAMPGGVRSALSPWSVFRELPSQTDPCESGEVFWQSRWQEPSQASGRMTELQVGNGTFVGRDLGQWEGDLYFLDRAGLRQKLLGDNILGLFQTANGPVAISGQAVWGINRGQVYALTASPPGYWQASMLVTLPGHPDRFTRTPDGDLIMVGGSWAAVLRDGGKLEWLPCR